MLSENTFDFFILIFQFIALILIILAIANGPRNLRVIEDLKNSNLPLSHIYK